jgi:hypothetical protein
MYQTKDSIHQGVEGRWRRFRAAARLSQGDQLQLQFIEKVAAFCDECLYQLL